MVPVVELRGSLIYAAANHIPPLAAAAVAFTGNCLPVPFIILFVRRVFAWIKKHFPKLGRFAEKLEKRAVRKGGEMRRGILLGLCLFVAIPLPGTGAWTGALIAAMLDIRLKTALPAICAGVAIAAVLVTGITYGFGSLIG
jgi:uncharacterized membrane protein